MAKKDRADLFDPAADLNSRGYRKNFQTNGEPDEALMQDLTDSTPFFKESNDRAKESAGGNLEDEQGLAVLASDTQAKDNESQLGDRSLVAQPHQLPSVDATETQTVGALTDNLLEVTTDGATTTRNNFLLRLKEGFRAWLDTLRGDVDINTTDIATNATNIATNTSNIDTNATNITNLQATDSTLQIEEGASVIQSNATFLRFNSADFDVVPDTGGASVSVNFPSAPPPTYSWSSFPDSRVNIEKYPGAPTATFTRNVISSSFRYVKIDKTVTLNFVLSMSATQVSGLSSFARVFISATDMGTIVNDNDIGVLVYKVVPPTSLTRSVIPITEYSPNFIYTDVATNAIYITVPIFEETYVLRGSITFEVS
jgi:hypothetical protein